MELIIMIAFIVGIVWLIKKLWRTIIRIVLYSLLSIPVWLGLCIFISPLRNQYGYGITLLIIIVLAVRKSISKSTSSDKFDYSALTKTYSSPYSSSSSYSSSYVLNKKTGVIHDSWSDSASEISDKHKKYITSSEAQSLVDRGTRYRYKKDP